MKTLLLSSLNKVFKDTEPNFSEFCSFSSLKNENFSFQIGVLAETDSETDIKISVASQLEKDLHIYFVKNIPAGRNGFEHSDSFHYRLDRKEFPDLLEPTDGKVKVKKGEWNSFWIEYTPTSPLFGEHGIHITVTAGKTVHEKVFTLDIINEDLPEQELLYTNWFHNDCLLTYYNIEIFSDEYWKTAENYIKNAVDHGMNMILTPVFTPPLDTEVGGERPTVQLVKVTKNGNAYSFGFENFEKYVNLCLKHGIKAFEISHFFTQWGATAAPKIIADDGGTQKRIFGWETDASVEEYTEFLKSFAKAFTEETEKLNIKNKCWLHVSDEPSEEHIENYEKHAELLHELFPDFRFFDALSNIEYYRRGIVKTPVCSEENADIFKAETEHFWTYHCCGQVSEFVPNRLFSQPSQRNRILGVLLYKYDAEGFLQWGHNFWYSQYSKSAIDPFTVTDAGGSFPSGDSFSVYPDKNFKPLNSLRNLVFADALQDLRAMRLLEKLTSREYVLNLLEKGLDIPLSFKNYPHEQYWLLNLRNEINRSIRNNLYFQLLSGGLPFVENC